MGTPIPEAYSELTDEAFAFWMRLHHCSDEELKKGRAHLARAVMKKSESRCSGILQELRLKGYIAIHSPGLPRPSTVTLIKRCKIVGRTKFITLSRLLGMDPDPVQTLYAMPAPVASPLSMESETNHNGVSPIGADIDSDPHWLLPTRRPACSSGGGSEGHAPESTHIRSVSRLTTSPAAKGANTSATPEAKHRAPTPTKAAPPAALPKKVLGKPMVGGSDRLSSPPATSDTKNPLDRPSLDLSKMQKSKEDRSRAKRDAATASAPPRHPDHGKPIDWDKLDKTGAPAISFSPSPAKREVMIRIVNAEHRRLRPNERRLRSALISKLRTEFVRIYTRYRRAALMEKGATSCHYEVSREEYKYAEKVAIACIVKGVTPKQVLKYWHDRIKHFANRKMQVPPLTFLSQPAFIDEVSISLMDTPTEEGGSTGEGGHWKPGKRKTMYLGDTSQLHPRLRRDLMAAGFDLSKYNDTDLATIQDYAMDVKGEAVGIKLVPEALRPMIKWALDNTLKACDPKDFLWRE
jgi:hypothetical protein